MLSYFSFLFPSALQQVFKPSTLAAKTEEKSVPLIDTIIQVLQPGEAPKDMNVSGGAAKDIEPSFAVHLKKVS
ncbi:hypothetical protein K1719_021829 [Acacia pycnantha]|nr:hypothetical protein K1719_021829 [Acacia pycnantha]